MTTDPLDRFKVDTLVPESRGPNPGSVYQLTADSISPVRITGRDRWGGNVEETVPTNGGKFWVHPSGCINTVPMMTSPVGWKLQNGEYVGEGEHVRYAYGLERDLIRDGWIPLNVCPFTMRYQSVTRTSCLVDNPDHVQDCDGKPDGCEHLRAVMKGRAARAAEKHAFEMQAYESMKPVDVKSLMTSLIAGMQDAADARAATPAAPNTAAARKRMVEGKGDTNVE